MNDLTSTSPTPSRHFKCPRCTWVHIGISLEDAQLQVRQAQAFYVVASRINHVTTRGPEAYLESYKRCFKCGAPSVDFVPVLPGEVPIESTQQTVIDDDAKMSNDYTIPDDFPRRPRNLGAVPGAQDKFLAVEYQGRYYPPGCTPPELHERWRYSMSLVEQFVPACIETKKGKRKDMPEVEILDQYLTRLIDAEWVSNAEASWVIRETAKLLDWPTPEAAFEPFRGLPITREQDAEIRAFIAYRVARNEPWDTLEFSCMLKGMLNPPGPPEDDDEVAGDNESN